MKTYFGRCYDPGTGKYKTTAYWAGSWLNDWMKVYMHQAIVIDNQKSIKQKEILSPHKKRVMRVFVCVRLCLWPGLTVLSMLTRDFGFSEVLVSDPSVKIFSILSPVKVASH